MSKRKLKDPAASTSSGPSSPSVRKGGQGGSRANLIADRQAAAQLAAQQLAFQTAQRKEAARLRKEAAEAKAAEEAKWADLVEEVCHIEHLHEHPLSVVSDSTIDPEAIQLRAAPTILGNSNTTTAIGSSAIPLGSSDQFLTSNGLSPSQTGMGSCTPPPQQLQQHQQQPIEELSGGFRCHECKKLRYGKVYTCRTCPYRCCDSCAKLFLAEQEQLLVQIEQEEQALRAEERLGRLKQVQTYAQSASGGTESGISELNSHTHGRSGSEAAKPGATGGASVPPEQELLLGIDGLNPFMEACVLGDFKLVKDRIDRNEFSKNLDLEAVVETGTHRGRTALLLAAQHGHRDVVTLLLSRGGDAETIDNYGMTPLMHSAHRGHLPVLNELVFAEVTLDRVAFCGYTALLFASNGGHPDCVRRLISAGSNPEARTPSGRTGLIIAALNGHISTVRYFLHHTTVDAEAEDDEGYSAKDAAIAMKEATIERILTRA